MVRRQTWRLAGAVGTAVLIFSLALNGVQYMERQKLQEELSAAQAQEQTGEETIRFRLFDESEQQLVLKNGGEQTLDGASFRLYHNEEVVDADGCNRESIPSEAVCVLSFDADWLSCAAGDRLEATYKGTTVYTRNCL